MPLTKADGAELVAIITMRDGSHFLECFLRGKPPAAGFPSEIEPIYDNSALPSFPAISMQQARKLATELAGSYGYGASEIVWETA